MMWLFAILLVLAMGGIALLAAGKGTPMAEVYDDRPDALVPAEGDLTAEDVRRVRFSLAFRGYRMSEVDALLERLAAQVGTPEVEPEAEPDAEPDAGPDAGPDSAPEPEPVTGAHAAPVPAAEPVADPAPGEPTDPPVETSAEGRGEPNSH